MRERLKMTVSSLRKRASSALWLSAFFALGAGLALGCGWYGTEHSVRFNRWHSESQFSRLPPLPFDARKKTTPDDTYDEDASDAAEERAKGTDALWTDAAAAVGAGDFSKARKLLHDYVERTGGAVCGEYGAPFDCGARRVEARDQLDTLASLDRGASARAVSAYLEARDAYDGWLVTLEGVKASRVVAQTNAWQPMGGTASPSKAEDEQAAAEEKKRAADEHAAAALEVLNAALGRVPREPGLEDNVAYLRAAVLYRSGESDAAAEAFAQLASRYPRSEKREAALYMRGVVLMRRSIAYTGEAATFDEPCDDGCDDSWAASVAAFERVLREYPRGDYTGDARGWLAYMRIRGGQTAEGLAEYYRMLADESDADAREEALHSLHIVRDDATEEDISRVESLLDDEPRAALAYAYHDIYNYASSDGEYVEVSEEKNPYSYCKERAENPCWDSFFAWEDKERQRILDESRRKALSRVAAFATRLLLRTHGAQTVERSRFASRRRTWSWAKTSPRALSRRARSLRGSRATSAPRRSGCAALRSTDSRSFVAARRTFELLSRSFPKATSTEGARRYVAMAAEDAGDLDAALEQYLALDYTDGHGLLRGRADDARAARLVRRAPRRLARATMLLYSLGVRSCATTASRRRAPPTRACEPPKRCSRAAAASCHAGATKIPAAALLGREEPALARA
jgi:TolA-binding protein